MRLERGQDFDSILALTDPDGEIAPFARERRTDVPESILSPQSSFTNYQWGSPHASQNPSISNDKNYFMDPIQNITMTSQPAAASRWPSYSMTSDAMEHQGYDSVNSPNINRIFDHYVSEIGAQSLSIPSSNPTTIDLFTTYAGSSTDGVNISSILEDPFTNVGWTQNPFEGNSILQPSAPVSYPFPRNFVIQDNSGNSVEYDFGSAWLELSSIERS